MKVVATEQGFYRGNRYRFGTTFDMDEADMKKGKDGPILPRWVEKAPASDVQTKIFVRGLLRLRDERYLEAAITASGDGASGGAVKAKRQSFTDAMNAGRGPQAPIK